MKINPILIAFAFCSVTYAQSNELGIVPFKLEKNAETINNHYEPKFLTGLYYQHTFDKFHWIISAEYGENSIDDGCNSCADHYSGTGLFEELNLYVGFGKQWNISLKSGYLQPLVRIKGAGMAYNYLIRYEGGISGGGGAQNRRYYFVGGELETGLAYYHPSNFIFRMDCSLRLGYAWSKKGYPFGNDPLIGNETSGIIGPKLSLGYRF
ncbi:MAG: hypothetical protein GQ574_11740 [Crocinitomix sp.]|nr:hypothetical protein [Crocinitomix sp.]